MSPRAEYYRRKLPPTSKRWQGGSRTGNETEEEKGAEAILTEDGIVRRLAKNDFIDKEKNNWATSPRRSLRRRSIKIKRRRKTRPPLLALINFPPPTQILTLIPRVGPQAPLATTRRRSLQRRRNLWMASLRRPLRANHGKRVKFRSSRLSCEWHNIIQEKPKRA